MTENEVQECLRALAKSVPQSAGPSVEQRLLMQFRERRVTRRLEIWVTSMAACLVLVVALYFAVAHSHKAADRSLSPEAYQIPGFVTLPYAESGVPLEQPVIVRMNIPASELGTMGVPFPAAEATGRIRVDLLVGQDGVARAVRVVQ